MGVMDTIFTCPRCGLAGRWVDLAVRGDIAEESGWRSATKLFHICERRPKSWWRSLRNWLQGKPAWVGKVDPAWNGVFDDGFDNGLRGVLMVEKL
jgi:hypothetical protein